MENPFKPNEAGALRGDELAGFTEAIAQVTESGLPLAPGLFATAAELPRGRLRFAIEAIARSIEGGASVEEAVAKEQNRLPAHLRGLILIGARTGKLSQVLGRFVDFITTGVDLRRRLWINLAYPVITIFIAFLVFVFICSNLIASFVAIFKDFGVPLPGLTIALIWISRPFSLSRESVVNLLIGLVLLWLLSRFLLSTSTRRGFISGIPLLGQVWRNTSIAEFCHLMSLLVDCEIPLPEALRLTGEGVCDSTIERACRLMGQEVEGGLSFADAISRRNIFPRGLGRLFRWAEGHQSLSGSLDMAGEMFETRARTQANLTGTILSVLAVVSIFFGVSLLVTGLFLPLITLISKLSG